MKTRHETRLVMYLNRSQWMKGMVIGITGVYLKSNSRSNSPRLHTDTQGTGTGIGF